MLDLRHLREHPDLVKAALARRGVAHLLDDVLACDARWRELLQKTEEFRHRRTEASKDVGRATAEERPAFIEVAQRLKADVEVLEDSLKNAEDDLQMMLARLPNLPHESVPSGESDDDNVEIRTWGEPQQMPDARDHLDIGRLWGVIDTERAANASGSRFAYLMGDAVWLEFALVRFAFELLEGHGFAPVLPPVLVRRHVMFGAGALPGDEAQYYITQDGTYLTGTSEQALAAIHMDEVLGEADLPRRYTAFSSCFRREAGAWGRDTRGIFRVHQFDKVEMFSFSHPDTSWDEHEFLVARQEELLQALGIPYRVMNVCTGELGAPAAKKIDLEAWFPGQQRYREVTSCSNCTDFQSRRLQIRMSESDGRRFVHTLNGTAITSSRTVAALLENFQEPDGSVTIPEVLHPYLPARITRIPRS
jgi:seryl-tRNA synthetase